MHCPSEGFSWPALWVWAYLLWKSKTASLRQALYCARGKKPLQELIIQPVQLCNTTCAQRENSHLNSVAIFFIPWRPRFDCMYGTSARMPINAASDCFTQLLTFSSASQEGVGRRQLCCNRLFKSQLHFSILPSSWCWYKMKREKYTGGKNRKSALLSVHAGSGVQQAEVTQSACWQRSPCPMWRAGAMPALGVPARKGWSCESPLPWQMPLSFSCSLSGRQSLALKHFSLLPLLSPAAGSVHQHSLQC